MMRAYLDNNATTRPAPSVVAAMLQYLEELYLNPSSAAGRIIQGDADPVVRAKRELGALLGSADLAEGVMLTSGASESNSWAVFGATHGRGLGHIVVSGVEHPSVRRAVEAAGRRGFEVAVVPVDRDGRVCEAAFRNALSADTCLVSVMLANNETGVVQPLERLSRHVREQCPQAIVHCDATAALGRIAVDMDGELGEVDLLSLSGHKFHGPKGVGALFVRPGLQLPAMIHGEQEEGLRGGTSNTHAAAGIAEAARLALGRGRSSSRVERLRDELEARLLRIVPSARVNGAAVQRLPNTSSIVLPGLDAAAAVDRLATEGICVSTGSACSAGASAPSAVLLAMGLSYADALSTMRFSLSHETTEDEIEATIQALGALVSVTA